MAEFKFGFEDSWFRLILKNLPNHPDLFSVKSVEKAQSILRIGKLKVGAARNWAEAAGIIYKNKFSYELTPLGKIIQTHDPDMDEDGLWWALHYNLSKQNSPAWFYSFYINNFDKDIFSRDDFETAIRLFWDINNDNTMTDSVFNKLIFPPTKQVFENTRIGKKFSLWDINEDKDYYRGYQDSSTIHCAILSYALLDWAQHQKRKSVHLEKLLEKFGIGRIFRLDKNSLDDLLVLVGEKYNKKVAWISHTAGLNSVSIMDIPPISLICTYYNELDGEDSLTALTNGIDEVNKYI